jgi:hypothetical protein
MPAVIKFCGISFAFDAWAMSCPIDKIPFIPRMIKENRRVRHVAGNIERQELATGPDGSGRGLNLNVEHAANQRPEPLLLFRYSATDVPIDYHCFDLSHDLRIFRIEVPAGEKFFPEIERCAGSIEHIDSVSPVRIRHNFVKMICSLRRADRVTAMITSIE